MKVLCASLLAVCSAHMSMVIPKPRNAVDSKLPEWSGGKWWPYKPDCTNCTEKTCVTDPHEQGWDPQRPSGCTPPGTDGWGCNCANGTSNCDVGQSCFWFSNGCTIGCSTCTGLPANPNTKDLCASGMKATVCDKELRTYNVDAECNSDEDIYKHNPWRAPGHAPVFDSCGMAGGSPKAGGGESKITNTMYTNQGYQYRLCPLGETLDEECFFKLPLPFVKEAGQVLQWSNNTSTDPADQHKFHIPGTYVSSGTLPLNSTWAMNPLPYSNGQSAPTFDPPCNETVDRKLTDTPSCSGRDPFNTLIIDQLYVPATVTPGKYVLGIRWDCEKSAQIWTNCADIEISA